jgi:N-acetylmuramic acid 6-phosphate etherase
VPPPLRITEQRNARTADIDLADARGVVELLNAEDRLVADAVAARRAEIAALVEVVSDAFRPGGRRI